MLFATPPLKPGLQARLTELDELRDALGRELDRPVRWMGTLRRSVRASAIEGSTSIEGYSVPPAEAISLTSGEMAVDRGDDENRIAIACYARAMDHLGALALDPAFRWLDRVILDLHFDACHFQPDKRPGLWRSGPIGVTGADGSLEYQAPDANRVPGLMAEVVDWLQNGDPDAHVVVRAAMAHLHVTSVHPFNDGNGRLSRIVQSLVLARERLTSPEFLSIEEYLGRHTSAYYAALRQAQGGSYQPERDASKWVAFCVDAHLAQARQRLDQIKEAAARWERLEEIVSGRDWPERLAIALEQSLIGGTDRGRYGKEAGVSQATASGDFRRLLDAGLVEQRGRGRSTRYHAAGRLLSEEP
jgi:DNA-binding transcriptional ArsR family regulator